MSTAIQQLNDAAEMLEEIKEVFRLNDVRVTQIQEVGRSHILAHVYAPGVTLWKVAKKIEGCFCRDYSIERIAASGNGYQVTLLKTELLPADQQ